MQEFMSAVFSCMESQNEKTTVSILEVNENIKKLNVC